MDEEMTESINDIVSQLNNVPSPVTKIQKTGDVITRENLEEFVLKNASRLVERSLDMVEKVHELSDITPDDPEAFDSAASILKAADSAIQSLSKILLSNEKLEMSEKLKKMHIESKEIRTEQTNKTRLIMSREDMFKYISEGDSIDDDDIVDI